VEALESAAARLLRSGLGTWCTVRHSLLRRIAAATYRVAAAANYLDEQNGGDLMLVGPPVTAP